MDKQRKSKVLYLITKSNWGGAQRYVYDLATQLRQGFAGRADQWEAVVACGPAAGGLNGEGLLEQKLRAKNVRVIPLPEAGRDLALLKDIKLLFRLFKIIKIEKPDVLHVNSSKLAGLGAFACFCYRIICKFQIAPCKLRCVFTAHGWPFNEDRNWFARLLMYKFSWLTSLFADITITINNPDYFQGRRMWFVGHRMHLIHNAIDQVDFYDSQTAREKLLLRSDLKNLGQRFDLGNRDQLWIGTIAELHKNKGQAYLIEALDRLKALDWQMIIIGGGELRSDLKNLIQRFDLEDRVKLVGSLPDASKYLKAFDIFVLPSLKEGLPYTLLEAAQAALPSIATDVGGVAQIIANEGMLIPRKDSEQLARCLNVLIKDRSLRVDLGKRFKEQVSKSFSFEKFLAQTYSLYR